MGYARPPLRTRRLTPLLTLEAKRGHTPFSCQVNTARPPLQSRACRFGRASSECARAQTLPKCSEHFVRVVEGWSQPLRIRAIVKRQALAEGAGPSLDLGHDRLR